MATVQTVNLLATAIKGKEAFQVAEDVLKGQFNGKKPHAVNVNLSPCAKELFRGHRDHANFEQAVKRHLIA